MMDDLIDKVNENRSRIGMLTGEQNNELNEVKNQIVEAVSDVLL